MVCWSQGTPQTWPKLKTAKQLLVPGVVVTSALTYVCDVPEPADLGYRLSGQRAPTPNESHLRLTRRYLVDEGSLSMVFVALHVRELDIMSG